VAGRDGSENKWRKSDTIKHHNASRNIAEEGSQIRLSGGKLQNGFGLRDLLAALPTDRSGPTRDCNENLKKVSPVSI